jgi:methanogen homoisocitrate dehydrogenase
MKHVLAIPGDGIGPEVIIPSVEIIKMISGEIDFEFVEAGKKAFEKNGEAISAEVMEKAGKADAIFFGATTTVRDSKFKSPILELRYGLDLYANVRPLKTLLPDAKRIDMVIIRENTEGLYSGREEADLDGITTFRRVSSKGCKRIVKFAFSWCKRNSRKRIACVHKANVLKLSDGMFLDAFNAEAAKNKKIASQDMLIDSTAMRMVMMPEYFDTIVTLNLYGDILSDLGAGLIGGLGFAPSANIGEKHALFEPAHGSAPDIACKGIANPFAALMSGQMMLEHLGFKKEGQLLSSAITKTITGTKDLFDQEGRCATKSAIDGVKANLK